MSIFNIQPERSNTGLLAIITAVCYLYLFVFIALGISEMLTVLFPAVLLLSVCVFLSMRGRAEASSGLFLVTALVLVSTSSFILGSASGAHLFFIPLIGMSSVILNRKSFMYWSFVVGAALMLFLVQYKSDERGWLLLSAVDADFLFTLNLLSSLLFVFMSLHFLLLQRDAAESKISALHNNMTAFIDSKDDLFFLVAPDYKVIVTNKAARNKINVVFLSQDDYLMNNLSFLDVQHLFTEADATQKFKDDFAKALAGAPVRREVMQKKGFESHCMAMEFMPAYDAQGQIFAVSLSISDITEQKMRELEMQDAKTRAESLVRIKSAFVSGVSHEIRTPMNAIMGLTDLVLEEEHLAPDVRNYLSKIKGASQNLLVILDDVLDHSKIEAGKFKINQRVFDLKGVVQDCFEIHRPKADAKGLRMDLIYDESLPSQVNGDPVRLGQVLHNLLSNAVKFTDKGFVKLAVNGYGATDTVVNVRFAVSDTGVGIPENQLLKIFDSFFQVEEGKNNRPGGTGLGLSISKSLVELQGGEIMVESRQGIGTGFNFIIPLGKVPSGDDVSDSQSDTANSSDRSALAGASILVAEDNQANSLLLVGILKKWGVTADVVETGRKALNKLATCMYDAVLMDIQMPEMDGLEAVRKIRSGEVKGIDVQVPIIGLSANAMDEMLTEALRAGMNLYITKPFDKQQLYRALTGLVAKKEGLSIRMTGIMESDRTVVKDINAGYRYLNMNLLSERVSNDKELMLHVLKLFRDTYKDEINMLFKLLEEQNMPALRRLAHKLRSGFHNVGMTATAGYVQLIEDLADNSSDNPKILELTRAVRDDFMNAEIEIATYLESA